MSSRKKNLKFQAVVGTSLNGKITGPSGGFEEYSSGEDKKWLQQVIEDSDVLLMGRKTFELHAQKTKKPMIILSKKVQGISLRQDTEQMVHWFNDRPEDLYQLCDLLQYKTITLLGGAQVYSWAIENQVLTDIYVTIEPVLFSKGLNMVNSENIDLSKRWKLQSHQLLNKKGSVLLHYQWF